MASQARRARVENDVPRRSTLRSATSTITCAAAAAASDASTAATVSFWSTAFHASRYAPYVAAATAMRSTKIATRHVVVVASSGMRSTADTSSAPSTAQAYSGKVNDDASTTSTAYESGIELPSSRRSTSN